MLINARRCSSQRYCPTLSFRRCCPVLLYCHATLPPAAAQGHGPKPLSNDGTHRCVLSIAAPRRHLPKAPAQRYCLLIFLYHIYKYIYIYILPGATARSYCSNPTLLSNATAQWALPNPAAQSYCSKLLFKRYCSRGTVQEVLFKRYCSLTWLR